MPLFACTQCGCVENTACCNYWTRTTMDKLPALCSECDPDIGKWHGRFEKRSAAGMLVDQNGQLWSRAAVDGGGLPSHYRIVGEVLDLQNRTPSSGT
jgi:hypothetical protein